MSAPDSVQVRQLTELAAARRRIDASIDALLCELRDQGVSWRALAEATELPPSTLQDRTGRARRLAVRAALRHGQVVEAGRSM